MNIQELKKKTSENLISQAEELGIENASTLRKQEILFCYIKKISRKRRGNNGWWSFTITSRWFWIFKSNGI